jgi:hypothetical protein
VQFESDSRLRRIQASAFSECVLLRSLCIPVLADRIDGSAFQNSQIREIRAAEGNRHFRVSGSALLDFDGRRLILYFGRDRHLRIDDSIEVICTTAFALDGDFSRMEFGDVSKLRRIESRAFSTCRFLQSIFIPSLVDSLHGSAFCNSAIRDIRLSEDNRHFRVSGDFLLSFDGRVLIHYFGRDRQLRIERDIEVLSKNAFALYRDISSIEFLNGSKLRRIESHAFSNCRFLQSLCIPSFVDTIDGSAFANSGIREILVSDGNRHFRVLAEFLLTAEDFCLIRYFGLAATVTVLPEIAALSKGSFSNCSLIRTLLFESDSKLRRIDSKTFSFCPLLAICIPSFVDTIDGSAFADSEICEIRVAAGNSHFRVSGDFLLSSDGTSLIRYFGRDFGPRISCEIEVLAVGAFASCQHVRRLEFAPASRVRFIGERAFEKCYMLYSISLPPSTEVLSRHCFRKCARLREVRFERDSTLTRIECESFRGCPSLASIFLPISKRGYDGTDLSGLDGLDLVWYDSD